MRGRAGTMKRFFFTEGDRCAQYELTADVEGTRIDTAPVRCIHCGTERYVTISSLVELRAEYDRRGTMRHCSACAQPVTRLRAPKKVCPHCYDLPHARPRVGLCRCGMAYRVEQPSVFEQPSPQCALGGAK